VTNEMPDTSFCPNMKLGSIGLDRANELFHVSSLELYKSTS
jgi:hypothetical protein